MTTLKAKIYTGQSLTIVLTNKGKSQTKTANSTHPQWASIVNAYRAKDWTKVAKLIDAKTAIATISKGRFTVKDESVLFNGAPVSGFLFTRIIENLKDGLDFGNLLAFADLLWENPSNLARTGLYSFLENKDFTIDEQGYVIGWKGVRDDYYSLNGNPKIRLKQGKANAAGQIYNGVGETIEMDRADVDDSQNAPCSVSGLHIGNRSYATGYGSRLMVARFSPRDVVALARGDCQKLRVCMYEVIAEEGGDYKRADVTSDRYVAPKSSKPKRDANGRFSSK